MWLSKSYLKSKLIEVLFKNTVPGSNSQLAAKTKTVIIIIIITKGRRRRKRSRFYYFCTMFSPDSNKSKQRTQCCFGQGLIQLLHPSEKNNF